MNTHYKKISLEYFKKIINIKNMMTLNKEVDKGKFMRKNIKRKLISV